jgi:hypothetical protein
MKSGIVGVSLLLVLGTDASAQRADTTLKSTTIEVIQAYKPEVKQAPKPEFRPDLPPRDTSRPAFRYDVPQQALYYTYSSLPLRPLALGKDTTKLPFPSYVKLGGGTQSTIYFDAGIANLKGSNYETALHLHHLSQTGAIKNQRVSLSGGTAEGTVHAADHAFRLSLEGSRNRYHFYGYNHELFELDADSVQQTYTGVRAAVDVRNEKRNRLGIDYHPKLGLDYYTDAYEVSERTVFFDAPFTKAIDTSLTIGVGVRGAITKLSTSPKDLYNDVIQFTPHLVFQKSGFSGRLGLYPTAGSYYDLLFLPDIEASYRLPDTRLSLAAGWKAGLKQNSFRELTTHNPYLLPLSFYPSFRIRQTRTDEVFGMVTAAIGNHFTVSGRLSWQQYENLPLFLNDTMDGKNFYVLYDPKVSAISFRGSLQYQVADRFAAGVTGTYTSFNEKTYERVWHEPGMQLKADMMWRPLPELTLTAYVLFMDQIYAMNELRQTVKLPTVFDAGAQAEYQFIPRLSAFISLNNLFNNHYQRWYGYETLGINVYGGLRLKF